MKGIKEFVRYWMINCYLDGMLMNTACSKAFMATGHEQYRQLAISNMQFILQCFHNNGSKEFYHTWKNGVAKYPAFLDDYAFLIQALIQLQEITSDLSWLYKARELAELIIENFSEPATGFFYYTHRGQADVIIRKKEVYDGATPSGNAIMAFNLHQLSIIFDKKEWRERSLSMLTALGKIIAQYPTSFGIWACLVQEMTAGTHEVVIIGSNFEKLKEEFLGLYLPHRILMCSTTENQQFPLLSDKPATKDTLIYLCKDFACQQPVTAIERFITLINRSETFN